MPIEKQSQKKQVPQGAEGDVNSSPYRREWQSEGRI